MRARSTSRARTGAQQVGAFALTAAVAAGILGGASTAALAAPTTHSQHRPAHHHRLAHRAASRLPIGDRHPRLVVIHRLIASPTGSTIVVRGRLEPRRRGAVVRLVARAGRGWRTLATGRTFRSGRFGIHLRVSGIGATSLRVAFKSKGGPRARAVSAPAGQLVALIPTIASWYDDAGNTACGFHATFGVANRTLPCGTKVTIAYGGRTVVATVDDRGPYVYGRSFDLNQNTARYLGMWGVGQVFASA